MKTVKKIWRVLVVLAVLLSVIFCVGRYGWKLAGFHACQSAGITSVAVDEDAVHLTGFYPGSFPEGFCGYYSEERDGKLYVGFRFSAVFGFFERGDFDITIPVQGDIDEVIVKSRMNETPVWDAENGFLCQSERYGVFMKLEREDVYYVSMSYDGSGGGMCNADGTALESGEYFYIDNDIMMASKDADAPVPFTITAEDAKGTILAEGEFSFDANAQTMYLIVTADGRIVEETIYEG